MYKILATCGNGIGSSLLMEMKVKSVFASKNIDCDVSHCSLGEAKTIAGGFDIVFCPVAFQDSLADLNGPVLIALQNVLSEDEIIEKCQEKQIF